MRRVAIVAGACLVLLLVVAQFALPPLAENEAEERLTRDGGTAAVDIDAIPAIRLLVKDGGLVRVRARGIELPLVDPGERVLAEVDGFDEVDVRATDSRSGPLRFDELTFTRAEGARAYRTTLAGTVAPRDLGAWAGDRMAGPLGGLFGGLAGNALPYGDRPVPLDLDATIRSADGRPQAVTVDGSVAGIPAGPLAEVLAEALAAVF